MYFLIFYIKLEDPAPSIPFIIVLLDITKKIKKSGKSKYSKK